MVLIFLNIKNIFTNIFGLFQESSGKVDQFLLQTHAFYAFVKPKLTLDLGGLAAGTGGPG